MTKSPVALAQEALALAQHALDPYSSARSRHDFTQPQLFAILVLRQFFRTDYRGVAQLLEDLSDLREVLALKKVPHFTTLQKAEQRLQKRGPSMPFWTPPWNAPGCAA
jgi:isochorismate hydrolase